MNSENQVGPFSMNNAGDGSDWTSVDTSVADNPLIVDSGLGDGSKIELPEPLDIKAVSVDGVTQSILTQTDTIQPREKSDDLVVLTGNDDMKSQGSWVFSTQGVATEQGFRNVSQLWYPKTLAFAEGLEIVGKQKAMRNDITTDVRGIDFRVETVNDRPIFRLVVGSDVFTPTDWAARQLCNWLDVPQTMWVHYNGGDAQDLYLLCSAFLNGRNKYKDAKKLLFRTYKDGTLRGVMSDSYSIVDNDWYLETLQRFIPGGRLSHFHFSDADNFYGNILIPDTIRVETDSEYGGMLNCGNSAVGKRSVWQTPSIFRAICMNGCVWGAKDGIELRRRHRGIDLKEFADAIRHNIDKQIPLLTTKIGDMLTLHQAVCSAPIVNIFAMLAKGNNIGTADLNTIAETWLKDTPMEKTAFGVVDALTRAGQKLSADMWEKLDTMAGAILNGREDGWHTLNAKAKLLTEKEIKKAYGNAQ